MSRRTRSLGAAGLCTLAVACTPLGFGSLEVPRCEGPATCRPLNEELAEREGIPLERLLASCAPRYQCAPDGIGCVLGEKDRDGDGFVDAACGGEDCDDEAAAARPGGTEACDGLDNDCDGLVDEGTFPAEEIESQHLAATGVPASRWPNPSEAPSLRYGTGGRGSAAPLLVSFGREGAPPLLVAIDPAGSATSSQLDLRSSGTDLQDPTTHPGLPMRRREPGAPAPEGTPSGTGPSTCQQHEDCFDGVYCNGWERCEPDRPGADARGCIAAPTPSPCSAGLVCLEEANACEGSETGAPAAFAELVPAAWDAERALALAVDTLGCEEGGARPGLLEPASQPNALLIQGDARRSTVYWGVDLAPSPGNDEARCTGASRGPEEPLGLAWPALAPLAASPAEGRLRPQALAAWLALPHCAARGRCTAPPDAPATIELLGLWHEQHTATETPIIWLNGSRSGRPQRLSASADASLAPFGLAAITYPGEGGEDTAPPWSGYALAHGRSDGTIALYWIPAFRDPPGILRDRPPHPTPVGAEAPARETLPIEVPDAPSLQLDADTGPVGAVSLAPAEPSAEGADIGLLWEEAGRRIYWARVRLDSDGTFEPPSPAPQPLATGEGIVELRLQYVPRGLRSRTPRGGWVASWVQRTPGGTHSAWARRIDARGRFLDTAPIRLAEASGGTLRHPRASLDAKGRVRLLAVQVPTEAAEEASLVRLPGLCDTDR